MRKGLRWPLAAAVAVAAVAGAAAVAYGPVDVDPFDTEEDGEPKFEVTFQMLDARDRVTGSETVTWARAPTLLTIRPLTVAFSNHVQSDQDQVLRVYVNGTVTGTQAAPGSTIDVRGTVGFTDGEGEVESRSNKAALTAPGGPYSLKFHWNLDYADGERTCGTPSEISILVTASGKDAAGGLLKSSKDAQAIINAPCGPATGVVLSMSGLTMTGTTSEGSKSAYWRPIGS